MSQIKPNQAEWLCELGPRRQLAKNGEKIDWLIGWLIDCQID
jgi:hypothetical protein